MLEVLVSWIVIAFVVFTNGYVFRETILKDRFQLEGFIYLFSFGLLIVTAYANIYSLFSGVNILAFCIIFFVSVFEFIFFDCYKTLFKYLKNIKKYDIILLAFSLVFSLVFTVGKTNVYDTDLYHFQAIKWIEDYGVVPGLGNLHKRFAYNSTFLPLQALFSFSWIQGINLHQMNGFIVLVYIFYALDTNDILLKKKIKILDLIKIASVYFIFYNRSTISSPTTDILPLLIVSIVAISWEDCLNKKINCPYTYAYICMLTIYATTLKLSAALSVLLSIYPIILFIKEKEYKSIIYFVLFAFAICSPWLVRTVLISGYLVFPYSKLDIFNFDWKIPASIVDNDMKGITVWGRGLNDNSKYDYPLSIWLPLWFSQFGYIEKGIVVLATISVVFVTIYTIYFFINHKLKIAKVILNLIEIAIVIFWFKNAPLIRFGMLFLFLPMCNVFIIILNKKRFERISQITSIAFVLGITLVAVKNINNISNNFVKQYQYQVLPTEKIDLNGIDFYYPSDGDDRCGCGVFPCAPKEEIYRNLELRGENISYGFRYKGE